MSQHLLDGAQIGSAFQQMCGKGMAEGVRTDFLMDARQFGLLLDDKEYHHTGKRGSPAVQEENILRSFFRSHGSPKVNIILDFPKGGLRDGHQALLRSFPLYTDKLLLRINIRNAQRDQFRHTQATTIKHLQHGAVSLPFRG